MKEKKTGLLQGTLDLLVLKALALGPRHGLGVSHRIEQITKVTCVVAAMVLASGGAGLRAGDPSSLRPAIQQFHRGEFSDAKQQFEQALATDAKNAEARFYLGRIALEERRLEDGLHELEQATMLNPTNAVYVFWLGRAYGLQATKAGLPGALKLALKSKATFEKAIALDPDFIPAREDLIQFHRRAPGIIGGSRKIAEAQAKEVSKRNPYLGSLIAGDLLIDKKKPREAEVLYQSAVELKPANPDAFYRLGMLHLESKEFEKAFSAFEKILSLDTNEMAAFYYIGKTGALSGQRLLRAEEALKIYLGTKPRLDKPSLAQAHFGLGQIYERKGDRERARAQFQKALDLEPDDKDAKAALRELKKRSSNHSNR